MPDLKKRKAYKHSQRITLDLNNTSGSLASPAPPRSQRRTLRAKFISRNTTQPRLRRMNNAAPGAVGPTLSDAHVHISSGTQRIGGCFPAVRVFTWHAAHPFGAMRVRWLRLCIGRRRSVRDVRLLGADRYRLGACTAGAKVSRKNRCTSVRGLHNSGINASCAKKCRPRVVPLLARIRTPRGAVYYAASCN